MSVKADELIRRIEKIKELESVLVNKHMQAGYVCGLVNGLKLARSVISGEEAILEREEVQPASDNSTKLILQKVDINGGTQGFVMITFDDKGALLKLDQI